MREPSPAWNVIVVGAGPVGLMAANLSAAHGLRTLIIEQAHSRPESSRAIGIMPPSLRIFSELGLLDAIVNRAVTVTRAYVHGRRRLLGTVRFDSLKGPTGRLLSLPQAQTERVLTDALVRRSNVTLMQGAEVTDAVQTDTEVALEISGYPTETADFVLFCDGDRGSLSVRQGMKRRDDTHRFKQTFLMGDFIDESGLGDQAHLFFTPLGAVESFPLPDRLRRWIVQTDGFIDTPAVSMITETVAQRAGHRVDPESCLWMSPFGTQRRTAGTYVNGRIVLCGDTAHVMPPIGGQGMNTGFGDAWMATSIIAGAINEQRPVEPLFRRYEQCRAKAAAAAAKRAVVSMRIGTLTGGVASAIRNGLIYGVLHSPLRRLIPPHFAMQTIPFSSIEQMGTLLTRPPQL